jgi:hypothetical protein
MSIDPILLIGGSGAVGRRATRYLREMYPDTPLLIAGRNRAKAEELAANLGNAEGVVVDLLAEDLGLGDRAVSAVAMLMRDETLAGLRYSRARGVPHISIAAAIEEIGLEAAAYMHDPRNAAIVLGTEWLVGATSIPTLEIAQKFAKVRELRIGALLDDEDPGGPAQVADLEALKEERPAALTRRDGRYFWRRGNEAAATFRALDGTPMEAFGLSGFDVIALATATGAPNIEFNLATGMTSSRRRGEPMSTEIIIELMGEDPEGRVLRTRHAVVHPDGQFPLTGLGVALVLERLVGLDGKPAVPPGLYFPHQLLDHAAYFERFEAIGGQILDLDVHIR